MGLKVMIGAWSRVRIAATAAAHVSPLADWADLDGPLLISRDPFTGSALRRRQSADSQYARAGRQRSDAAMKRRYAILAPDRFERDAKTAHGVIAYGGDDVVAVIDPSHAGRRVRDVLPYLDSDAPIVSSVAQALEHAPTSLLIGTAPKGGGLPSDWRAAVTDAIAAKLEIVSGLHQRLGADREFRDAARAAGAADLGRSRTARGAALLGRRLPSRGAGSAHGRQRLRGR